MRSLLPVRALVLLSFVALLAQGAGAHAPEDASFAVVAVLDTGIRPDDAYAARDLVVHPASYLSGYPSDAQPLDEDLAGATSGALYYIPGTRIVGAVSFAEHTGPSCVGPKAPIRDDCGHGDRVAQVLLASRPQVLLVIVEVGGSEDALLQGMRWAAEQPYVDIISFSWQTFANLPLDGTAMAEETRRAVDAGKSVIVAAGNGISGHANMPDRDTTLTSPYSGPSWVVTVGATDACGNSHGWHAVPVDTTARTPPSGGTSLSTPAVARALSEALQATRALVGHRGEGDGVRAALPPARGPLADGTLTRAELEEALLATASEPRPQAGCAGDAWAQPPTGTPADAPFFGRGVIDEASRSDLARVLGGEANAPADTPTDTLARANEHIRDLLWGSTLVDNVPPSSIWQGPP